MRAPYFALSAGLLFSVSFLVACDDKKPAKAGSKVENKLKTKTAPSSMPAKAVEKHEAPKTAHKEIKAHQAAFKAAKAPAGAWTLGGETDVLFTIISKSGGPVAGHFPKGVKGFISSDGKGEVVVDLANLVTTNKAGKENAVRDARIVHSFFGVPFSAAAKEKEAKAAVASQEKVDALWKKLTGILPTGVAQAAYRITGADGLDKLEEGKEGEVMLHGNLILWDSLETHFMLTLKATKTGKKIVASSKAPATLHLEKLLGKTTRDLIFETLLAAGCGHQAGIHNEVVIEIPNLVLLQK